MAACKSSRDFSSSHTASSRTPAFSPAVGGISVGTVPREIMTHRARVLIVQSICVLILSWAVQAQSPADSVSDYVKAEMQRQHIPGLSLLVVRGGKILKAEGFGLANVELQVPVKPETIFQSGSVGKQFTATAVMMLVEEGKVGLDDP